MNEWRIERKNDQKLKLGVSYGYHVITYFLSFINFKASNYFFFGFLITISYGSAWELYFMIRAIQKTHVNLSLILLPMSVLKWASSRENLSSGFLKKLVSNQSPQLHRLAKKWNFTCSKLTYNTFHKVNNKGTDQTAWMSRLVCICVVSKPPKTGFLTTRPK